jgi:hypothetical protein
VEGVRDTIQAIIECDGKKMESALNLSKTRTQKKKRDIKGV